MKGSSKGFFITGTDTAVGKTVVTAGLLGALRRRGIDAIALKPVQSGAKNENGSLVSEDARFYRVAGNLDYEEDELATYCFEHPLAPAVAAEMEGKQIKLDAIAAHVKHMAEKHELVLVEGAGGLLVPLVGLQVTIMDLVKLLGFPLVIVARPGLGTINHTALTISCAMSNGLSVAGIIISGYNHQNPDPAERTNPKIIEEMTGIPVLGLLPRISGLSVEKVKVGGLLDAVEGYMDIDALLGGLSDAND